MDIFERDLAGLEVLVFDPESYKMDEVQTKAQQITAQMNTGYNSPDRMRELFVELTGRGVGNPFNIRPPFFVDIGKNIFVCGDEIFINHCCTFLDRGGITIHEKVMIGPKVNLITTNHPLDPIRRGTVPSTISQPIVIERNVWIAANATILPGVTIGEGAIIAAGAVVTKSIPPFCLAAGVPAKVIKNLR